MSLKKLKQKVRQDRRMNDLRERNTKPNENKIINWEINSNSEGRGRKEE